MKKFIIMALLACIAGMAKSNPSFTIGSNKYLTVFAYPHDILFWPDAGVFFTCQNQRLPWQGNVTDVAARPSASYVNNYQFVEFATPEDYPGNPSDVYSWAKISGYAYSRFYSIGGIQTTGFGKFMGELGLSTLNMKQYSEGVARGGDDGAYLLVPFESEVKGAQYNYDFKMYFARQLFNNPFGFKVNYLRKNSVRPDGYLNFTRDNVTYNTEHLTWGWANQSCNHIFGYTPITTDAFFQNDYSVLDGNRLDLQASYEINGNHKSGIRYRASVEKGDNYNWISDGTEFNGHYEMDNDYITKNIDRLIRAYSKVRYFRTDNLDAGILYFAQYGKKGHYFVSRNAESEPTSEEGCREYTVETNPFFNLHFEKGYVDFGFLIEGSYTRMKNIHQAWNESINANEDEVLWNTSPYEGWSQPWESFSKGHNMFFATGGETYSSVNVYKRLSLQGSLTLLRKYSGIRKVYGNSEVPEEGGNYEFKTTHTRKDRKNETWMTGSIGVTYGKGPVQVITVLQFPLAYLIKNRTKLQEENDNVLFEHEMRNVWQVQQPAMLKVIAVCALGKMPEHH